MSSRRVLTTLATTVISIWLTTLAATLLAQASSPALSEVWWTLQDVSDPTETDSDTEASPDIGIDSNGTIHLVWAQGSRPDNRDPCYAYSTDGGLTWSSPAYQNTSRGSYDTDLVLSGNTVHTTWWDMEGSGAHFYLYYSAIPGGHWGSTQIVTDSTDNMATPRIALAKGYIHLLWSQGAQGSDTDLYYSRRLLGGGTWLAPTTVVNTATDSRNPHMAADDDGNLHVVWQEYDTPSHTIYYISGTVGGVDTFWSSPPITISEGVMNDATTPDIAVDSNDTVHVSFGEWISDTKQYVWYAKFPIANPNSATPAMIPGSQVGIATLPPKYTHPRIDLNGTDQIHIVWNGQMGGDLAELVYHVVSENQGASWSNPMAVSLQEGYPDRYPALAVGADGICHVAWQQKMSADRDIYYNHNLAKVFVMPLALKKYQ